MNSADVTGSGEICVSPKIFVRFSESLRTLDIDVNCLKYSETQTFFNLRRLRKRVRNYKISIFRTHLIWSIFGISRNSVSTNAQLTKAYLVASAPSGTSWRCAMRLKHSPVKCIYTVSLLAHTAHTTHDGHWVHVERSVYQAMILS